MLHQAHWEKQFMWRLTARVNSVTLYFHHKHYCLTKPYFSGWFGLRNVDTIVLHLTCLIINCIRSCIRHAAYYHSLPDIMHLRHGLLAWWKYCNSYRQCKMTVKCLLCYRRNNCILWHLPTFNHSSQEVNIEEIKSDLRKILNLLGAKKRPHENPHLM